MSAAQEKALEAGASVEAEWDGRDFDALGRADKARYLARFTAAYDAAAALASLSSPEAPGGVETLKWKQAFAAQSRKLQAVLHIPGVREELAMLDPAWLASPVPDSLQSAEHGGKVFDADPEASSQAEPIAWVCAADIRLVAERDGYDISVSPRERPDLGMRMPLYTALPPASAGVVTEAMREAFREGWSVGQGDISGDEENAWGRSRARAAALASAAPGGWRASLTREHLEQLDQLGYTIVPKEPTEAMTLAGHREWNRTRAGDLALIFRVMLAAAPHPPISTEGTSTEGGE